MDNTTPSGFITLAEAEVITGYDPGAFTDIAYNNLGHDGEFVPACYLPQSDGSLKELTRKQVGNFPLRDERLAGILMREADARKLVEWQAAAPDRRAAQRVADAEAAVWGAHLDRRAGSDWD